ncbi:hypothetical protein ABE522_11865 [Stenotrophomonas pennii]
MLAGLVAPLSPGNLRPVGTLNAQRGPGREFLQSLGCMQAGATR